MATVAAERYLDRGPIVVSAGDVAAIAAIERIVADEAWEPVLIGADGVEVALPASLRTVLRRAAVALARDRAVSIVAQDRLLTTQEAADLLNVSRPYLIRLLEEGKIPHSMVGTHRRVRFDELLAFKREWDAERMAALNRLTQINQDLGLYERELRDAPPLSDLFARVKRQETELSDAVETEAP